MWVEGYQKPLHPSRGRWAVRHSRNISGFVDAIGRAVLICAVARGLVGKEVKGRQPRQTDLQDTDDTSCFLFGVKISLLEPVRGHGFRQ